MLQRIRTALDGLWSFRIPEGSAELRQVPGSYACVGESEWSRRFVHPKPSDGRRVHLCFDGIAYEGLVRLNGTVVGEMLPYCRYVFDITALLREENELTVELKDLTARFGPSEGWKSYSGIVRSVYLEETAPVFLSDVFFSSTLREDFSAANCSVQLTLNADPRDLLAKATLLHDGKVCARSAVQPARDGLLSFVMEQPLLWSPTAPNLYTLHVELLEGDTPLDSYCCQVGFKSLTVDGGHFRLNGETLFLIGVCRHDLWTDEAGFTQTDETIETDLRMIKQTGANYVRLVHYPHDKRVLEAADRIGLLVSEEPGLWWNDLSDTEITSRALRVLERTIFRDRSHVSVAFWLAFNECLFNERFLLDAVAVARRCDPTRLVSGANCNDPRETKEIFDKCGVDFYTMHPYGTHYTHVNGNTLEDSCRVLSGKPLVYTEWGGYYVVDNPALFMEFCREMLRLHRNADPTLAGMCYWQWQDIPEAQRGEPACTDGILTEGLVTIDRRPKMNYDTFARFISEAQRPTLPPRAQVELGGCGSPDGRYLPLPLPKGRPGDWEQALQASLDMPAFHWKKTRRMPNGPALPQPVPALGALRADLPSGAPLVLSRATGPLVLPIAKTLQALWFIGQATLGKGYPLSGTRGELLGSYILTYADGSEARIPLRNGLETATVLGLFGPTAFEPRAAHTTRAFSISYDKNWEIYHAGVLRVAAENKPLASVRVEVDADGYWLLLYGLTLEQ